MLIRIIIPFLISFVFFSCKNEHQKAVSKQKPVLKETLPPPTIEFMTKLRAETHTIDYLFRNTNFSITQQEPAAVQPVIGIMGTQKVAEVKASCVSPLRMTFVGNDGIVCDVEMYMTLDCLYQEYFIDGKATYAALVTEQAKNYLTNLIQQANSVRPPQPQGQ